RLARAGQARRRHRRRGQPPSGHPPVGKGRVDDGERAALRRGDVERNRFKGQETRQVLVGAGRLLAPLALLLAQSLAAGPARDWAQTAVDDLHFIRAVLRENHPGPVDPENPGFLDWYRQGFEKALERARQAKDFAGYFFSI